MDYSGEGYLRIRITELGGSLPIEGAVVLITEYEKDENENGAGEVLYSLRTNEDGLTERVPLPAPSKAESMSPGAEKPYAVYNISAKKSGYYPILGIGIQIFDGISALQPFNMLPISETNTEYISNQTIIYETPPSSLANNSRKEAQNEL